MKISAKSRYALVALINLAQNYDTKTCITLIRIAENLGISKIYLEQVFSLLRNGRIVTSVKGAQGGYLLSNSPEKINVYDILSVVEPTLFTTNNKTVAESATNIEEALQNKIYLPLMSSIKMTLSAVTLATLVHEAEKNNDNSMYYL